ncbi:MAG: hypothetical protein VSS75_030510 [Candidatus Parabeggiatoa sp.]|nr:hypothetical protein [Candidatus Parabeggiatoa sp.]
MSFFETWFLTYYQLSVISYQLSVISRSKTFLMVLCQVGKQAFKNPFFPLKFCTLAHRSSHQNNRCSENTENLTGESKTCQV